MIYCAHTNVFKKKDKRTKAFFTRYCNICIAVDTTTPTCICVPLGKLNSVTTPPPLPYSLRSLCFGQSTLVPVRWLVHEDSKQFMISTILILFCGLHELLLCFKRGPSCWRVIHLNGLMRNLSNIIIYFLYKSYKLIYHQSQSN